ncbi:MAG: cytochrome ubiquinol oxidase subunit I [Acidimicrobiales bacterium]
MAGLDGTFGDVMGLPFALEGIFFFLEAIFLGIYLYGWKGLPARLHLATLIPIGLAGIFGTFCILAVNGWMNEPTGFDLATYRATGEVVDVEPWRAMFNGSVLPQFLHMLPATYMVTGFGVASVYAVGWLRGRRDRLHRLGVVIGFTVGAVTAPIQLITGDLAARNVAADQPAKFAAIELLETTTAGAPMTLGGVIVDGKKVGAIEIPDLTSLLQSFDPNATITGLDAVPPDRRPPVNVVHLSFQLMVGIGMSLLTLAAFSGWKRWRTGELPTATWWYRLVALTGPAAVLALEAGWTTTETGRQPWIAQQVMLVEDAVTPRDGIGLVLAGFVVVYLGLGAPAWFVLRSMSNRWRAGGDPPTPYGPTEERSHDAGDGGAAGRAEVAH